MKKKYGIILGFSLVVLLLLAGAALATPQRQAPPPPQVTYDGVSTAVHFDVSPPLRSMRPLTVQETSQGHEIPEGLFDQVLPLGPQTPDTVVQSWVGPASMPSPIVSFDGPSNLAGVAPPDPVGDVGLNHYIAMSNLYFQVFTKTGTSLYGPAANNTLWTGFGGACETENAGDPVVLYDQLADRWMLTQFSDTTAPYYNCVALSTSPDPLGTYYRWAFQTPEFPDYPKYAVWSDAYYVSTRESTIGAYALNRAQMLAGNANPQVVSFHVTQDFSAGNGLLPADIDGSELPPGGSPEYYMGTMDDGGGLGAPQDALNLWKFHVDWATPSNSTFTLANTIPVAAFDSSFDPCGGTRACIPQPSTSNKLDILSYRQRPLWRLAYRNFGDHESLVTNQSVEAPSSMAGIRWYEIRDPNGTPTVYQQGTYAPGVTDSIHRWMGSIAMDSEGNMALGYSASNGTTTFPSVWYTGRLATDPLGTLPQGEGSIIDGTGSQTGGGNRWGDYTSMNVDPRDDCTFWYVNEYIPVTSERGWRLRIGAFKFTQCGTPDFTLNTTPVTQTICAPTNAVYSVTLGSVGGLTNPVTLSASGYPTGASANFSINPVIPSGGSVLTIGNTGSASAGSYLINIVGVAVTQTHTNTVGLNLYTATPGAPALTTPANGALNVTAKPNFVWTATSQAASYTLEIATNISFTNILTTITGLSGTSYNDLSLTTNTQYYWRVTPENICGLGTRSLVSSFTTQAGPGLCGIGTLTNTLYSTNFESGASGWTHNAASGSDTWVLTSTNTHSGNQAWHADDPATVADQNLVSPAVLLPTGQDPVVLKFWNWQHMETRLAGGCFDGGIVEVTTNGGVTWTPVLSPSMLTDPYDGSIARNYNNPLTGLDAWCGNNPQPYLNSVVDVSAYAGQTVQFRFRLGSDKSNSKPGWDIDDVVVQACNVAPKFNTTSVVPNTMNENGVITLTGTFTDTGALDTHTLEINWGDGLVTDTLPTLGAGVYTFMATHQYLDDNPSGTSSDVYALHLVLSDEQTQDAMTTTVTVNNIAPIVNAGSDQVVHPFVPFSFAGTYTDLGTLDTHTIMWDFGDGTTLTGTLTPSHTYTATQIYTATLTINDDDGGVGSDILLVNVQPWTLYLPLVLKTS